MANLRGIMLSNSVRFVKETYGPEAHDRVLAALPIPCAATFRVTIREGAWKPAADLVTYMETARRLLDPGATDFHRRLGAFAGRLEREAQGYRPMVADPSTSMRLGPVIWSSFYDAGRLDVEILGPREAMGRIYDFVVSRALCERTCGAWEGLLGDAEQPVHVTELACVHDGRPHCEMRVVWG